MLKPAKKPGFTMIELVMVLVILGLLGVLVLPRFIGLNKRAQYSVARHLEGVLKTAQEFYFLRLRLEMPEGIDPVAASASFSQFVGFSDSSGSDRNTINLDNQIRDQLQDPNAEVYHTDTGAIVLPFKVGATATYYISSTGAITAEYTGF